MRFAAYLPTSISVLTATVFALFCAPAIAADVDLGTLARGDAAVFNQTVAPGSYADNYTFQLSSGGAVEAVTTSLEFPPPLDPFFQIDTATFKLELFDNANTLIASALAAGNSVQLAVSGLALNVPYVLRVTYDAIGTNGGAYVGAIAVVPLPPAALLLLTGLCAVLLVGFMRHGRVGA